MKVSRKFPMVFFGEVSWVSEQEMKDTIEWMKTEHAAARGEDKEFYSQEIARFEKRLNS